MKRQRGVALITAVLVVALATILAVSVGFKGYLDQRRSVTAFSLDQGFEIAMGAEAWAADILRKDKVGGSKTDDFTEMWATPLPPIPVEGGEVAGQIVEGGIAPRLVGQDDRGVVGRARGLGRNKPLEHWKASPEELIPRYRSPRVERARTK